MTAATLNTDIIYRSLQSSYCPVAIVAVQQKERGQGSSIAAIGVTVRTSFAELKELKKGWLFLTITYYVQTRNKK